MVDEFLSEREQAEQLKRWFKENWLWLASGIALGIGGIYGKQAWDAHRLGRSAAAEQRFSALLAVLEQRDRAQGEALASELTGEYADTPYADQAELVMARMHAESGELPQAADRLARVMNGSRDDEMQLVARLRLARVQLAMGEFDRALATLDGARATSVAARVAELRGDVLQARGDDAGALAAYREALAAAGEDAAGVVDPEWLALKADALAARQEAR